MGAASNYARVPEDEYELPLTQSDASKHSLGAHHMNRSTSSVLSGGGAAGSKETGADEHDYHHHSSLHQTSNGPSQSVFKRSERRLQHFGSRAQEWLARTFRTRLSRGIALAAALIVLLIWITTHTSAAGSVWGARLKGVAQGWGYSVDKGATIELARKPHYDDAFNPDDLTFTEEQCDAYFPGLWSDIDRSVKYYTEHPFTKEYLELSCDDGHWSHARVAIYNNRLYLKMYREAGFTRAPAALALLHQSLITAREPLPNVEFCIGLEDWGSRGKFSLDRGPGDEEVWLMPDYGWWSWPEHVGSYGDIRMRMDNVERATPWEQKVSKLFWRGSIKVGTADRESLLQTAAGHAWNDVKVVNWDNPVDAVSMEDHCKWKFQGFPEGNTYSGRLRYLQNCKTVIVTHPPRWIQHWTHLYNSDWNSPDQNIVYVPPALGDAQGVIVHDEGGKEFFDRTWERLNEVMEALLSDDDKARSIAENQWNYFRNRYISPASAACYWRKLIKGFGSVQKYDVDLSGWETSYESFILKGMRGAHGDGHHRRGFNTTDDEEERIPQGAESILPQHTRRNATRLLPPR